MKCWAFCLFLITIISCNIETNDTALNKLDEKTYPYFDWLLERNFPDEKINVEAYLKAKTYISKSMIAQTKSNSSFDEEWVTQGPGNIGARINTVAVNPNNQDIIYAGFSGGGLFKTEDGGINWAPIFDQNPFLAIGDIAFDPFDDKHIYVGTGDPNVSGLPSIGNGLFHSLDGGISWEYLGLEEQRIISKVEIHPEDPDIIFVASMGLPFSYNNTRGIFKSTDGGQNWRQVLSVSDSTGFTNVIINPENTNTIYASSWDRVRNNSVNFVIGSNSGIFKSDDGGENWERVTNGLPSGENSRTGIEVCKNQPNNVYAVIVGTDLEVQGIYRSEDYGTSFDSIPIGDLPDNTLGGFGWYFGKVVVNPDDPDHVFVLGVNMYDTKDNGETWELSTPNWSSYTVHADKHDLQIMPDGNLYLATDGGLYKRHIDSTSWNDIENIATTQFYRVAYNPHEPNQYYGGAQDNGTTGGNEASINEWNRIFGGDGFQMVFDPTDPLHNFVETQRGNIYMTQNGGEDYEFAARGLEGPKDWDMQYIMSPHDNNILYAGTDRVYIASNSYDLQWAPISEKLTSDLLVAGRDPNITCLSESPMTQGVLYAGTNNGQVWGTQDGGDSWNFLATELPFRYVTEVKASPDFEDWAYVSFSGYKDGDNLARIYRTKDYGGSWESIASNLPDIAINDLYILSGTQDEQLFVATEAGVYASIDSGLSWDRLGNNMPNVTVYDLEWNEANNELIAGTFGRSIMTYPLDGFGEISSDEIVEVSSNEFNITPNPFRDYFIVNSETNSSSKIKVELFDLQGKKVKEYITKVVNQKIDISQLGAGTYLCRINDTASKLVIKI